ncbi:uncharacterized protein ARMOST_18342 [Armillaria ostoyae]|uniref:Uncharacterized protein n=1 Tax=Armillaria ostoyae TaxID=47428 RepID=A0A284S1K5_ARMOS|nr:uncharacterized protein ARMOST_18342 [Armillaria ostoyae]
MSHPTSANDLRRLANMHPSRELHFRNLSLPRLRPARPPSALIIDAGYMSVHPTPTTNTTSLPPSLPPPPLRRVSPRPVIPSSLGRLHQSLPPRADLLPPPPLSSVSNTADLNTTLLVQTPSVVSALCDRDHAQQTREGRGWWM